MARPGRAAAGLRLTLQGRDGFADVPTRSTLRRWIALALQGRTARITLRLVGRAEGRRLNRDFRRLDYPTNVLTFAYPDIRHELCVSADIVLCIPVIRAEAASQRKAFRDHLAHLAVHGVLHARGMNHLRPLARRRMEALEVRLLGSIGIENPYIGQSS